MKKIVFALLTSLMFVNCNAQKKTGKKVIQKKIYKMEIPNITKDNLEVPDLNTLISLENKKILAKTKDSSQLINENIKELRFMVNDLGYLYENGKLTTVGKITEDTIQKPIPRKNSNPLVTGEFTQRIQTTIDFYPNEKVHFIRHWINTPNGYFNAGNWYVYDEAGNLLQHIDHEKHFRMSYYEVAKIADSYDYPQIEIGRTFNGEDIAYWIITLRGEIEERPQRTKTLCIDDKTRKVLYETNQEEFKNIKIFDDMEKYGEDLYKLFKNK